VILLLVIAVIGAWIAFQQMVVARVRLQHDLFDRRYAVYQAVLSFVVSIIQTAKPSPADFNDLSLKTSAALFFFDEDTADYINEMRQRAAKLLGAKESLGAPNQTDEERERHLQISHENLSWFSVQIPRLSQKFKCSMKIPILKPAIPRIVQATRAAIARWQRLTGRRAPDSDRRGGDG
jgi:hypothetical protein